MYYKVILGRTSLQSHSFRQLAPFRGACQSPKRTVICTQFWCSPAGTTRQGSVENVVPQLERYRSRWRQACNFNSADQISRYQKKTLKTSDRQYLNICIRASTTTVSPRCGGPALSIGLRHSSSIEHSVRSRNKASPEIPIVEAG